MIEPPQGGNRLLLQSLNLVLRNVSQSFQEVEVDVELDRRLPQARVMEEIEIVTDKKPRQLSSDLMGVQARGIVRQETPFLGRRPRLEFFIRHIAEVRCRCEPLGLQRLQGMLRITGDEALDHLPHLVELEVLTVVAEHLLLRRSGEAVPKDPNGPPKLCIAHEGDSFQEFVGPPFDVSSLALDPWMLFHFTDLVDYDAMT